MALTVLHACFLAGYLACGAPKTRDTTWHDSSPHKTLQVWVSPTVQLEVLDWGGSGSSLVFLAGFGNSAHVFDNFAPSFVRNFRVLGITRRGFGASSKPASGYDTASLARDIVTVLDILDIPRASSRLTPSAAASSTTSRCTAPDGSIVWCTWTRPST